MARASLDLGAGRRAEPDPDSPFRLLLLGDFSARAIRDLTDPGSIGFDRLPTRIDPDTLEDVLKALSVELRLRFEGGNTPTITMRFASLDDFHPDRIYEDAHAFSGLRRLRESLDQPDQIEAAAAEIRSWGIPRSGDSAAATGSPPDSAPGSEADQVVSELLESAGQKPRLTSSGGLDSFVRSIVRPHLVPTESPERDELVVAVERAAAIWMRAVLHDRDFQALEATWRGADFLVRRLETGESLDVFLLDVSKDELAAGLKASERLEDTTPYRLIVDQSVGTPGAKAWSTLVGLYTFDSTLDDVAMLGRLAKIARDAGAPFLAAASPHILGCASLSATPDPQDWRTADEKGKEFWNALRGLPEASFLALALPRFLLRLPYGKETDPTEKLSFEELEGGWDHEDYLWGNPALACATSIGEQLVEHGWFLRPYAAWDIPSLPLHTRDANGQVENQPCAEVILTDVAIERILEHGLMPLASIRDHDAIRIVRFQSLSESSPRLSGPWRGP